MAQIPIFEGGEGPSDTSVRPTRIFLKQPEARPEFGTAGHALEELGKNMFLQQEQNQTHLVQAAYEKQLVNAKVQQAQTPFTNLDDYTKNGQALTDPGAVFKDKALMASVGDMTDRAKAHIMGNLAVRQGEFLLQDSGEGIVRNHNKLRSDLDGYLDDRAQLLAQSGPNDYPLLKQQAHDAIDGAIKTGTFTAQEGEQAHKTFDRTVDVTGAQNYARQDPAGAVKLFTDPEAAAKVYPNLTPADHDHIIGVAHSTMSWEDNQNERQMKALQKPTEDEFWRRYHDGTASSEWVNDQFNHALLPRSAVMLATGRPPLAEGNYYAYSSYAAQIQDPSTGYAGLKKIQESMDGDPTLNQFQRNPLKVMVSTRLAGMDSPLTVAKRQAMDDFNTSSMSWRETGFDPTQKLIAEETAKAYDPGSKGPVEAALLRAKNDLNRQLVGAKSEEDVQKIMSEFDLEKYRPAALPAPKGYVPPLRTTVLPSPPAAAIPALRTMKITPLPPTSVESAASGE